MADLQQFLFEQKPTRKQLLEYKPKSERHFRVCVYRNHSFELVEHTISAYLDYAGIGAEFLYSDYDDSLSFLNLPEDSDLLIVWLDMSRYKSDNAGEFIQRRLNYLTEIYNKPILFVPLQWNGTIQNDRIVTYSMSDIADELGERMLDARMEPFTGTMMSAPAIGMAARQLGLNYIPSMLLTPLKAVVVDLDNTLYSGVLGEDGIDGVSLTDGHRELQEHLHKMAGEGFFICVASKNDENDVIKLFEQRRDFPLKREDFSKMCVSWESKAQSVQEIAEFLNIGIDSILFIDDNPGEISSVIAAHPEIHTIRAYDDAKFTLEVLRNFPRMKKLSVQREDSLRRNDVIANQRRRELKNSLSGEEYIKSLEMKLDFVVDCMANAKRVAELANKTNQFIFSYKRYHLSEIEDMIKSEKYAVVTAALSDNLSDSGIIGVCCAEILDNTVMLRECFVSCRALGRGIDDCIVLGAIEIVCRHFNCRSVSIEFVEGERNLPAKIFLSSRFGCTENIHITDFKYDLPEQLLNISIKEN